MARQGVVDLLANPSHPTGLLEPVPEAVKRLPAVGDIELALVMAPPFGKISCISTVHIWLQIRKQSYRTGLALAFDKV